MKHVILSIILSSVSFLSFSQNQYISGTVKNNSSNEVMPFCKLTLKQDTIVNAFAISDMNGYFELPATYGSYLLIVKYIGFDTDTLTIEVDESNIYLGSITLTQNSSTLNTVEVKGSTKSFELDKNEYLVTEKMRAGTAKATDLLAKIDGVSYNRYSKAIQVDNEKNVLLLVNGLQKSETYIKNINPKQISKIEVIRDPSGQYGLEGYTSVINILLKKNYVGQELFISSETIFDFKSKEKENLIPISNQGINYNFTRKSFNFYAQAWTDNTNLNVSQTINKSFTDGLTISQEVDKNPNNLVLQNFEAGGVIGADYQISPKHLVSLETNINLNPNSNTASSYLITEKMNDIQQSQYSYFSRNTTESKGYDVSAFYVGTYSKNKTLKLNYNNSGSFTKSNSKIEIANNLLQNKTEGNELTNSLTLDWSHTLTKRFSYNLGTSNYITNKSITNLKTVNTSLNTFKQLNFRNNAFAYASYKISKPLSIKAGIAVENNNSTSSLQKSNFVIYRPHFDLLYKPKKWINFKLKYRANSDYPTLDLLNPQEIYLDNISVQKGNPNLSPSTLHTVSLKTNVLQGLLSAEVYLTKSNNLISPIANLRTDGIVEYNFKNAGNYTKQGVKFSVVVPFGESLFWQTSANVFSSKIGFQNKTNDITDWAGESQLIYVNEKHGLVAGVIMQKSNIKVINPQGFSQNENDFWAVMAQKTFLKEKASIMLLYMMPINFISDYSQDNHIATQHYTQHSSLDFNIIKNVVMLEFSYRFQSGKEIKTIDRKTSSGGLF